MTEKKTRKPSSKVDEVAKAMVANMKANMADPNFEQEYEQILQEAAEKALKMHEKDLNNAGIKIPKKKDIKPPSKT